jgi:hypothetical protein
MADVRNCPLVTCDSPIEWFACRQTVGQRAASLVFASLGRSASPLLRLTFARQRLKMPLKGRLNASIFEQRYCNLLEAVFLGPFNTLTSMDNA